MPNGKTVLLVEDNKQLNQINQRVLDRAGYRVLTALCLADARECMAIGIPDIILLDIMLPDGDGVAFCQEIRQQTAAPILFLTSVSGYEQTLAGLEAGGDDYLNKPFDLEMLLAKVGAFLRRDEIAKRVRQQPGRIERGSLKLELAGNRATVGDVDLLLTQKEFALLLYFVRHEGELLPSATIYEEVWRQPMVNNVATLKNTTSRLRKKLAGSGFYIVAERGAGYLFEEDK